MPRKCKRNSLVAHRATGKYGRNRKCTSDLGFEASRDSDQSVLFDKVTRKLSSGGVSSFDN
eukprot:6254614-Amphidinium_carterae.1